MGLENIQSTMQSTCLDMSLRSQYQRGTTGRGTDMAAESTRDIRYIVCHICREKGHYKIERPTPSNDQGKKNNPRHTKEKIEPTGGAGHKWCPFHNTRAHHHADNRSQGKQLPQESGSYIATAVLRATSSAEGIREDAEFDCGLMWMTSTGGQTTPPAASYIPLSRLLRMWCRNTGTMPPSTPQMACRLRKTLLLGAAQRLGMVRRNHLQAVGTIAMVVDSGATGNFIDNKLIPSFRTPSPLCSTTPCSTSQNNHDRRATITSRHHSRHSPRCHYWQNGGEARRGSPKPGCSRTRTQPLLFR